MSSTMVKIKTNPHHSIFFPDDVVVPPGTEMEVPANVAQDLVSQNRATLVVTPEQQKAAADEAARLETERQEALQRKNDEKAWHDKAAADSVAARKAADDARVAADAARAKAAQPGVK